MSRRIAVALLSIIMAVMSFAASKDLENDITMVSFDQSWMDSNATIALRNNSSKNVKSVAFVITYLDMSGNELDYEEFNKRVTIAPGKTKKIDIPAYEHDRYYHYYKSKGLNDNEMSPAFKVKFQLKNYNVEEEKAPKSTNKVSNDISNEAPNDITNEVSSTDGYNHYEKNKDNYKYDDNFNFFGLFYLIFLLGILLIYVGSYILVAVMAKKRHRSVIGWVLLSFVATPLLIIIILSFIGKDEL